jgi:hypothetical protein
MNFRRTFIILLLIATLISIGSWIIGLKNFCIGFVENSCKDTNDLLFFIGVYFPFILCPICALICLYLTKNRSRIENLALIILGILPFIFITLIGLFTSLTGWSGW